MKNVHAKLVTSPRKIGLRFEKNEKNAPQKKEKKCKLTLSGFIGPIESSGGEYSVPQSGRSSVSGMYRRRSQREIIYFQNIF
jgi:hypothetical protein